MLVWFCTWCCKIMSERVYIHTSMYELIKCFILFLGLIGFIFTLICLVNGTLTFLAPKLRDKIRPTTIKFGHAICGCIAISMGLITLCIAINTSWFIKINGKGVSGIATALVVLSLAFTLLYPAKSIQGFLANMKTTEL